MADTWSFQGNLIVPVRTSDPSPLVEGEIWDRSDLGQLRAYLNGTVVTVNGGGLANKAWQRIDVKDVAGAAVSSVTFSSINGDTDIIYKITGYIISTGTQKDIYAQPNADTTTSHYSNQQFYGNNSGVSASAVSANAIGLLLSSSSATASYSSVCEMVLHAKSGNNRGSVGTFSRISSVVGNFLYGSIGNQWLDTASNITSIKITTDDGSSNIGIGSHIELWTPR